MQMEHTRCVMQALHHTSTLLLFPRAGLHQRRLVRHQPPVGQLLGRVPRPGRERRHHHRRLWPHPHEVAHGLLWLGPDLHVQRPGEIERGEREGERKSEREERGRERGRVKGKREGGEGGGIETERERVRDRERVRESRIKEYKKID